MVAEILFLQTMFEEKNAKYFPCTCTFAQSLPFNVNNLKKRIFKIIIKCCIFINIKMHFCFIPTCGLNKEVGGGGSGGLLALFFSWIPALVRSPLHC
jgi:hypothetical protein